MPIPAAPAIPPSGPVLLMPDAVSPAQLATLARSLRRPRPSDHPMEGRQLLADALGMVAAYRPRGPLEAVLVVQSVTLQFRAAEHAALAPRHEGRPAAMERHDRTAMGLLRTAGGLVRQLRQHRRALAEAEVEVAEGPAWRCELAEFEAMWRAVPEAPVEAPPAPPAPAAKREKEVLPPWGKKRHWHELTDEELAAVREAERRGENPGITHAPGDPAIGFKLLPPREKYRGWENMTMAERKARWGYRSEAEIAADAARAVEGAPLRQPAGDKVEEMAAGEPAEAAAG